MPQSGQRQPVCIINPSSQLPALVPRPAPPTRIYHKGVPALVVATGTRSVRSCFLASPFLLRSLPCCRAPCMYFLLFPGLSLRLRSGPSSRTVYYYVGHALPLAPRRRRLAALDSIQPIFILHRAVIRLAFVPVSRIPRRTHACTAPPPLSPRPHALPNLLNLASRISDRLCASPHISAPAK